MMRIRLTEKLKPISLEQVIGLLSLKQRFYAITVLWLAMLSTLAALAIPTIVDGFLRQNSLEQLELVYDDLLANLEWDANGDLQLSDNVSDPRYQQPYSGYYWRASTDDQLLRSRSLWDTDLTFRDKKRDQQYKTTDSWGQLFDDESPILGANEETLIVLSKSTRLVGDSARVTVIIGMDEEPLELTVLKISGSIGVIYAVIIICLCALLFVQLHWTFRPFKKLQISVSNLEKGTAESVKGHYPSEIMPLVTDLNALLFHYNELLQRSRNHAGNLSHALKTPLTVLKQDAMALSEEKRAPILKSIELLQSQIEFHLAQARVAGAKNILAVESNPSDVVDRLSMAFDKVYQHRDVLLVNELNDDWRVKVDEQDLNEIIGNIIENGYKWASSQVRVSGKLDDSSVSIRVEDDGAGVEDDQLLELAVRGRRFDETTAGSGLGLSIANVALESYSGSMTFTHSSMGGLCVDVRLPRK
jgi:signal transduction histidine kinase